MADREMNDVLQEGPGADPVPDPIADKSLSGPILIFTALMLFSLFWAIYDEVVGQRPWKDYQERFVRLYTDFLEKKLGPQQTDAEQQVRAAAEFQQIEEAINAATTEAAPRLNEINRELDLLRTQLTVIREPFQNARAEIAAITFELERSDDKESHRQEIEAVKRGPFRVRFPTADGSFSDEQWTFNELEARVNASEAREAQLNAALVEATKKITELRQKRDAYLSENLAGLNRQQIEGLISKTRSFSIDIKQIHVEESDLVDRCESCHLGIREPVTIKAADMGGERAFISHPNTQLLAIHDPTRFGCAICHNGNGRATASVEKAHGTYKHWLWPLFPKENVEAGCLQCHFNDRVLEFAPVLTEGRDLFQQKGCVACHRYEGYDRELDTLSEATKEIQRLDTQKKDNLLQAERSIQAGDRARTNEEAQQLYALAEWLRIKASNMEAKIDELRQRVSYLEHDRKMVGPKLKEIRLKLRKEWIPVWLKDPQAFRPGTKMPSFRLTDEEIKDISAFVWQAATPGPKLPTQPVGNATRGKELFETRGCLACHSIGEGSTRFGGVFAGNLSRLGEKADYSYIVHWIHNPRERNPMAVMPNLRLTWEETQDIASYLTSLKHQEATYPAADFMDDTERARRGRALATRYGCASCHEISGMENAARIGTELTKEASKPLEQLDFGLLEHQAKDEGWYNHKGFIENKLRTPNRFDQGKEKAPQDLLRMPKIQLTDDDIVALTTFLMGSVDSPFRKEFRYIPEQFRYVPTGLQKDIQEGWWVIKKYNCMGCHTIQAGQASVLSTVPRYQDPDWKDQLPPSLLQEGARVKPDWLIRFLTNPALSETDVNRNGVRKYLHARMPTFDLSPNEVSVLTRFFQAMAGQKQPHFERKLDPLTEREKVLARALFTSQAAPCLKCHEVGNPARDRFATAPNFLLAKERLQPDWTGRWLLNPQAISPGTAMPSGLFRRADDRWVFAGPTPAIFGDYNSDHVDLLVRYMFEITADEQQRLIQMSPTATARRLPRRDDMRLARAAVSH